VTAEDWGPTRRSSESTGWGSRQGPPRSAGPRSPGPGRPRAEKRERRPTHHACPQTGGGGTQPARIQGKQRAHPCPRSDITRRRSRARARRDRGPCSRRVYIQDMPLVRGSNMLRDRAHVRAPSRPCARRARHVSFPCAHASSTVYKCAEFGLKRGFTSPNVRTSAGPDLCMCFDLTTLMRPAASPSTPRGCAAPLSRFAGSTTRARYTAAAHSAQH
jgi:hypothetical protein